MTEVLPPSEGEKPDLTGVRPDVQEYIYTLERKQKRYLLPRPPLTRSVVDFVVQIFVILVATILLLAMIGTALLVIGGYDAGPVINSITDITNTIIGALIGFVAGKGAGKQEAHDEHKQEQKQQTRMWQDGP